MGKGQKAITVTDAFYEKIKQTWEQNKAKLVTRYDVTTHTSYAQKLIELGMKQDTIEDRFEIISKNENVITVRDYYKAKDFEVVIRKGKVYCESDQDSECQHIGFVMADPEVRERAKQLGVKLRRA